jgi:hypothetical protein
MNRREIEFFYAAVMFIIFAISTQVKSVTDAAFLASDKLKSTANLIDLSVVLMNDLLGIVFNWYMPYFPNQQIIHKKADAKHRLFN